MIFGKTPSSWTLLDNTSLGIPPTENLLILPQDRFYNLLINLSVGRNFFCFVYKLLFIAHDMHEHAHGGYCGYMHASADMWGSENNLDY